MKRQAKKVLLIGWDAADWKFLTPLIDEGLMPTLKGLIEGGVSGKLATLDPPLSPTLWTSIATGKRPYKHGIHGFTEPDPSGKNIRPTYITSRKVKAIWNILTQQNLKSNVIGWWPSHPAEPINGVMVSNFYHRAGDKKADQWPMAKGIVHPESLSSTLAKLRIHPAELTASILQQFVPEAYKVNQSSDRRLYSIAKTTAECSTIQSASTYIMENHDWDFMGIYFDAIDHYCHGFMKYHPPHRPHVSKKDYELYKDVVRSGCIYHDMMLSTLLQYAGEDTVVVLVSDHGFHPDHNRPEVIPKEPSGPAIEHSPFGIVVMNGPGIKKDELIFGANLLDITPTLLTIFGLPVAEDMDGKVLSQVFEEEPVITSIRSWENLKSEDGTHKTEIKQSKEEIESELKQLVALGYIEDPGNDRALAVKKTKNENNYYLARSYIDGGKWKEGIEILATLYQENPKAFRYGSRLVHAQLITSKYEDARNTIDTIRKEIPLNSPQIDLVEGGILMAEGRPLKALELFKSAEQEAGKIPRINLRVGMAYLQLKKYDEAEKAMIKELDINPEESQAWHLLGIIYHDQLRYQEAVDCLLKAIGLIYYFPASHYYLGESLMGLGKFDDAANAFDVCLRLAPGMNSARLRLIDIYEQHLNLPGKAFKYKTDFDNNIKGELVIVSGLPRSGTSMMMQMLEAGGLEIFTDKKRSADESNPKGYYEHEDVKSLKRNKSFLKDSKGKVVKVSAQLLPSLPMKYRYQIVFMERNVLEVVASQQKMLIREGKKTKEDVVPVLLVQQYEETLKKTKKWADIHPNVNIHFVDYSSVIKEPFMQSMLINDFLNKSLEVDKMAASVEKKLYREKISK